MEGDNVAKIMKFIVDRKPDELDEIFTVTLTIKDLRDIIEGVS